MTTPDQPRAQPHIGFLDQLRGVAIFLVFTFHCVVVAYWASLGAVELKWNGWLRDFHVPVSFWAAMPFTLGWIGVPIFFVISGFCIHLSHARSRKKSWPVFFVRRFFRIYPPYLAALLFFALLFPWTRLHFGSNILHVHPEWFYSLAQLGTHVFLTHNFSEISVTGINPAFWSIAVEVQLYLLYPILAWIFRSHDYRRVLWVTGCLELGLRACESIFIFFHPAAQIPIWFDKEPLMFWFSWAIGAALAEAYLAGRPLPFRHSLVGWPLLFLACYLVKPLAPFCFTLAALSTACLIRHLLARVPAATHSPGRIGEHFRFAGTVSYSAYLIHMPLLYLVPSFLHVLFPRYAFPELLVAGCCLLAWPAILGASFLMYRLIELPSIACGNRLLRFLP